MDALEPQRTKVFVSYSHLDKEWLERLKRHLKPLSRQGVIEYWDDTQIRPGDDWRTEIHSAIDRARVAVLLITANFFASDFINDDELPDLLASAEEQGVRIIPVIVSASQFTRDPRLARFHAANATDKPLNSLTEAEQEEALDRLAQSIESLLPPSVGTSRSTKQATARASGAASARLVDGNRQKMLEKVRREWIDGYLKNSLENLARIELGLDVKPDAVSNPWELIVQQEHRARRPLPMGQPVSATFDDLGQAILILGSPGAGKTTLLLELARDLLNRAGNEPDHPMPIVFHLASWAAKRAPLEEWLVAELAERYYVPQKVAQRWVDADDILPLLDGLDEVTEEFRPACVQALNTFVRARPHVPIAVCSRAAEYDALPERLHMSAAVAIQPLTRNRILHYMEEAGDSLAGVRVALRDDEMLWELLSTPLMLSVAALTYSGESGEQVRSSGSLEQRRKLLFERYTQRMFDRRSVTMTYTREQTLRWLSWLANSLVRHKARGEFLVEQMQPEWAPTETQRMLVALLPVLFCVAVGVVVGGISGEIGYRLEIPLFWFTVGAFSGPAIGALVGSLTGLAVGTMSQELSIITPAEKMAWSWRKSRANWGAYIWTVMLYFIGPTITGFVIKHTNKLDAFPFVGVTKVALTGVSIALPLSIVLLGFTPNRLSIRSHPNEGIQNSISNGGLVCIVGAITVFAVALSEQIIFLGNRELAVLLSVAAGINTSVALFFVFGGLAYIKHYILRFFLWHSGVAPWRYVEFLDYCAERIFLRKVGGSYLFAHPLLKDYFSELELSETLMSR